MSDLFEFEPVTRPTGEVAIAADTQLADRMRPRSLDEVEGPDEVMGANGFCAGRSPKTASRP
jgi:replication-associated recombination protein RarA